MAHLTEVAPLIVVDHRLVAVAALLAAEEVQAHGKIINNNIIFFIITI